MRRTAPLRWAPALWAAYAQAVAFAAAAVTAFLAADVAGDFAAEAAVRWWPLAAFALGFVVTSNGAPGAGRRTGGLGRARWTGSVALAGLVFGALALALAPAFWFAVAAAGALGVASGLVVAIAGRVVAAAEIGDGSASLALSAAALLAGIAAGVGALFALPLYGWRGVFGLVVVAGVLAAWQFAAYVPAERER